jgi:hypothetical protein
MLVEGANSSFFEMDIYEHDAGVKTQYFTFDFIANDFPFDFIPYYKCRAGSVILHNACIAVVNIYSSDDLPLKKCPFLANKKGAKATQIL